MRALADAVAHRGSDSVRGRQYLREREPAPPVEAEPHPVAGRLRLSTQNVQQRPMRLLEPGRKRAKSGPLAEQQPDGLVLGGRQGLIPSPGRPRATRGRTYPS